MALSGLPKTSSTTSADGFRIYSSLFFFGVKSNLRNGFPISQFSSHSIKAFSRYRHHPPDYSGRVNDAINAHLEQVLLDETKEFEFSGKFERSSDRRRVNICLSCWLTFLVRLLLFGCTNFAYSSSDCKVNFKISSVIPRKICLVVFRSIFGVEAKLAISWTGRRALIIASQSDSRQWPADSRSTRQI